MSDHWIIIYRDTQALATQHAYFTEQQAIDAIAEWKRRNKRGGRPDITMEKLDRMYPISYEHWISGRRSAD